MILNYYDNSYFGKTPLPITKHSNYAQENCYLIISRLSQANKQTQLDKILKKKNFIKGIISTLAVLQHFDKNEFDLIECSEPEKAWGALCQANCGTMPQKIIAFTGTNGKTSTTSFASQILCAAGCNVLLINSLGIFFNGIFQEKTNNTTPDAYIIYQAIQKFCDQFGTNSTMVLEVSSIAIEQERIFGLHFDSAIWTNFSSEHMDYHQTMENYANAKLKLQNYTKSGLFFSHDSVKANTAKYGKELLYAKQNDVLEIQFLFENKKYNVNLDVFGEFQAQNLLSAIVGIKNAAIAGLSIEQIMKIVSDTHIQAPAGRMQKIRNVIIDNAHKSEALETALANIQKFIKEQNKFGKIICVMGCGGDRDKTKRPIIGRILYNLCDLAIITSDNPRSEDPVQIINEIIADISDEKNFSRKIQIEVDRKKAIINALKQANEEDIVLIAGRGCEEYQTIGNTLIELSDAKIVADYFKLAYF